jgi:hypothetical protein
MKKKCMAVGGTAKKPASMEEQLAALRGKVRQGYQSGGIAGIDYPQSFSGQFPARQPLGSGLGATAIQSGEAPVNAPGSTPQSLGLLGAPDYSTGPKQGGFIYEDGTPRPTESTSPMLSTAQAPLLSMAEKESALGLNPNRVYKPGSAMDPLASGGGISQAIKVADATGVFRKPAPDINQLAQFDVPRRRGRQRPEFADGGILDKLIRTVGKILPESNGQKYEPGIQSRAAEDPARHGRAEALNPRTQTAPSETLPAGGFQEEAARRRKQMEEAMNYEAGGMVRFAGKGGPRDDRIPVKVAGQEINVSNGENAVILPAKTAANPAALYAIGGIIQATNDGRKPKMGMENGGKYKDGVYPYDDKRPPTSQEVYAGVSPAGMVQAITPDSWRTARVVAPAGSVGGGMSSSGTDPRDIPAGGTITNLAPALQQIHNFAKPAYDLSPSMRALGSVGSAVGNVFADSAEAQRQGTTYGDARAARIAAEGKANAAPYSNEGRPSALGQAYQSYKPQAQGIAAGIAQPSGAVVNDGMTTTQMGAGFDPTKLQMADGYGMMTNAAGKTIAAGNTEYVGADGKPTSRWTNTQQYKDAIARNEADKLRLAEMQAQRLGADPMAVQKASQGISQAVMQAPLDARMKQQQIQQGDIAAQNANELRALYEAHKTAKTPEERGAYEEAIRVRTGKDNKLLAVDLGSDSVTDAMGNVKAIPRGQAVIDQSTKQRIPLAGTGQQQTGQQAEGIKAQLAAGKISREKAIEELRKIGFQ